MVLDLGGRGGVNPPSPGLKKGAKRWIFFQGYGNDLWIRATAVCFCILIHGHIPGRSELQTSVSNVGTWVWAIFQLRNLGTCKVKKKLE